MIVINNIQYSKEIDAIIKNNEHQFTILKFGAKWCKPCIAMKEEFTSYIKSLNRTDSVLIDIDIDELVDIDEYFQISKIPYFIIYNKETRVCEFNSAQMHIIKANFESYIPIQNEFILNEDF